MINSRCLLVHLQHFLYNKQMSPEDQKPLFLVFVLLVVIVVMFILVVMMMVVRIVMMIMGKVVV